jgi:uncharacterized protein
MTTATARKRVAPAYMKALDGEVEGTFEAIVAVFNNIDLGGDRIIPGAFAASIAAWKESGDPIPVIFSHRWDDLDAHIGITLEAKEVMPGASELAGDDVPAELKAGGGLYIKGLLDVDEDFAARVWKRMKRRSIKEFSFAYDIPEGGIRVTKEATDLLILDLIEVGPTLKGMNPATALLDAKTARGLIKDLSPADALELLDSIVIPPPPATPKGMTPAGAKRLPGGAPAGAVEVTLDQIATAANVWASMKYGQDLYRAHLEATYLGESKTIITAERWSDPLGEGPVWELSYDLTDDGATITKSVELELEVTFTPKADRKSRNVKTAAGDVLGDVALAPLVQAHKTASALVASAGSTVPPEPAPTAKSDEEPAGAKSDDELEERLTPGSAELMLADLDLEV